MILNDIITQKKKDIEEIKRRLPLHHLRETVEHHIPKNPRSFLKAVSNPRDINLICELKKASPSEGVIREDFQPLRLASQFEYAGAAAISVLTEPHYFKGRPSYLKTVRQVTKLPILRKDFILESYQLYESALLEADAFLLIASILTHEELKDLISVGRDLKMDALVEVHTNEDLEKALKAGAGIIGVNNRDLRTLQVDSRRAKNLIPLIPKGIAKVVESGLSTHEELMEYKSLGVNSFLVGTIIMKSKDVAGKIHELLGTNEKRFHS